MNSPRNTSSTPTRVETVDKQIKSPEHRPYPNDSGKNLVRLYWAMRITMAFIWAWTAFASWFVYPRAESLDWLRRVGLTHGAASAFLAACVFDLAMGVMSCFFPSRRIWRLQFVVVVFYSIVIAVWIPSFLFHPFGPLTKNMAVLCCIAYLVMMEGSLNRTTVKERGRASRPSR